MRIIEGDLEDSRVAALVTTHVTRALAESGGRHSCHALDLNGLRAPGVTFWTIWQDDGVLGCGALKILSTTHGEVKSMHTSESARRTGIGGTMLRHIITEARARGLSRLSLETGSWPYFQPARQFYQRHGFIESGPFGDYALDPNSVFMSLDLKAA